MRRRATTKHSAKVSADAYDTKIPTSKNAMPTVVNDNDNDNVNDNDNDNDDTLREVPHLSNEGLALQAHEKESVVLLKLARWQGVHVQTGKDSVQCILC